MYYLDDPTDLIGEVRYVPDTRLPAFAPLSRSVYFPQARVVNVQESREQAKER